MAGSESPEIEELLREALSRAVADRADYLDEACKGDARLRSRIEQLLAEADASGRFLKTLGETGTTASLAPPEARSAVPDRIGRYRCKRTIAAGGMGIVYEAVQEKPRRTVALKVMRRGVASHSALRRFEYESQILARLRHPNIAQVYEAGTHDDGSGGVPFFAMEYIPSAKMLTEYVIDRKLDTRDRLELFVKVCDAVQHGHQKGIIHRDLKPSNILVDFEGEPKIIDFGVARATDSDMAVTTLQSDVGQLIGTLQYMSPEQCAADPHDLDLRSDVYALGVILYELLCGELPYNVSRVSVIEAARVIREQAPSSLSTINRSLRGDLETIVLKALDKDRARRYQSSADLAADIGRYLHDEPIVARPPSAMYQLRKFARRNQLLVGGVTILIAVLAAAAVVSAGFALSEAEQRRAAARERDIARAVNEFLNEDLLAAVAPSAEAGRGRDVLMRDVLDEAARRIDDAAGQGGRFEDKPLIEASIHLTLGVTYHQLGEYSAAAHHLERAQRLRTRVLGDEHPDTLACTHELAVLYRREGRYEAAEPLAVRALEIRTRVLGEEHPDTLDSLSALAALYFRQSRYDQAEPLNIETLEIRRRVLGDEHKDTLLSMSNLAGLYIRQGRYDDAEPLLVETLEVRRRVLGEEHPMTLGSEHNLAALYWLRGRYDEAESLILDSLDVRTRVQGETHPDTLGSMGALANVYAGQGRYEEAEATALAALDAYRNVLGDEHPSTLLIEGSLGGILLKAGRIDEAERLLRHLLTTTERVVGDDDWLMPEVRASYGMCLVELGRYEEAESLLLEAYPDLATLPHATTNETVRYLAKLYDAWGKPELAAKWQAVLDGEREAR